MALQLEGHKLTYHLKELHEWQQGKLVVPLHIDLGPTSICNVSCVHCYVKDLPDKATYLSREVYEQLMLDMPAAGVKSIYLAGRGEPLMHPDTPDMIIVGKRAGLDIGLCTNGVLLTPKVSEKVLEHLVFARFNVLANTPGTFALLEQTKEDNFYKLRSNIEYACEYRAKNNIKTTLGLYFCLFKQNAYEMYPLSRWAKDVGLDYIAIKPAGPIMDGRYLFDRYLHKKFSEEIKKTEALADENFNVVIRLDRFDEEVATTHDYDKCYGIDFIAVIDSDGTVSACTGMWKNPKGAYGNLYEKNFKDIWQSERRMQVRHYINEEVDPNKCYVCRQHHINEFLWKLKNPPNHINFI